jgi:hypothetical protein
MLQFLCLNFETPHKRGQLRSVGRCRRLNLNANSFKSLVDSSCCDTCAHTVSYQLSFVLAVVTHSVHIGWRALCCRSARTQWRLAHVVTRTSDEALCVIFVSCNMRCALGNSNVGKSQTLSTVLWSLVFCSLHKGFSATWVFHD